MEKPDYKLKETWVEIGERLDLTYLNGSIDDLIETITEYKEQGATHIESDGRVSYDCAECYLTAYKKVTETEAERDERIAIEQTAYGNWVKESQAAKENLERRKYEALKAKFENQ